MAMLHVDDVFSDSQALTATAVSTNIRDLGTDRDIGRGEPMAFIVNVDVAADFTTADETYTFELQTDGDVAFGSLSTIISQAVVAGSLTAGSEHVFPLGMFNERYLRANYTLAGTTPSITVSSRIAPLSSASTAATTHFPGAYTI